LIVLDCIAVATGSRFADAGQVAPERSQQRHERCEQNDEDSAKRLCVESDESGNELEAGVVLGDQGVEGAQIQQKGDRRADQDHSAARHAGWVQPWDDGGGDDTADDEIG